MQISTTSTTIKDDVRKQIYLQILSDQFCVGIISSIIDNPKTAAKASSILAIVGLVNLPIIHYSVKWWNTLHLGSILEDLAEPSVHPDMLWPLIIMAFAFQFLYGVLALVNARDEVLVREQNSRWVRAVVTGEKL